MLKIVLKRIYENASPEDGYRILVDRLWPRGLSKDKAEIDEWNKDLAPSTELRHWFHHDPDLWPEFSEKYLEELHSSHESESFCNSIKSRKKSHWYTRQKMKNTAILLS